LDWNLSKSDIRVKVRSLHCVLTLLSGYEHMHFTRTSEYPPNAQTDAERPLKFLGKLLGGGLGAAVGGPFGAAAGFVLGHTLDSGWLSWKPDAGLQLADPRIARIEFLFLWLGHLAKADGRVSENEIAAAEALMAQLKLDHGGREIAVRAFQRGRQGPLDASAEVVQLRMQAPLTPEEPLEMLRALTEFARRDGVMTPAERGVIERLGAAFGIARETVGDLVSERTRERKENTLEQSYLALGLNLNASDEDIARAYRRLLGQHHPDKLQGQGADADSLRKAEIRTREVRGAYERILGARGKRV